MWAKLWRETASTLRFAGPPPVTLTTAAELAELPPAARRYMAFYGVAPGQPKHWSFCLQWTGRFRMARNRQWMPIEAVQYDTRSPVARVFHMRARMLGFLPLLARDTYARGHGHMLGRIADLLTVVDGRGPEFDDGELVTWLNDCVLFAPSMLLGPSTRWSGVDARSFDVSFTDHDRTVTARVTVDDRGAPVEFVTTDRFLNDPDDPKHPLVRGRWSTPIEAWQTIGDRTYPRRAKATWNLATGDFTYAELEISPETLAFDVSPVVELGHTADDDRSVLPGDDVLPAARVQVTHDVYIEAPPTDVWPWLVQMGRRRGGWYSWDLLDNGGVASADRILPSLQNIAVGEILPVRANGEDGFAVLVVDPPRALVLGDPALLPGQPKPPAGAPRATWAFSLQPVGTAATHLVVRVRVEYEPSLKTALLRPIVAGAHELMQRKQLRTLKQRAEAR